MEISRIERINELARKSKTVGLTEEEKKEQAMLRKEYIAAIRMNIRSQLDNISIQEADGSITNLGEKYGNKKRH
ncbi:DUF896 domain-containing protein [Blautia sp. HCP3S3_G3]|uniref:DUF896 domain-containing protein n=1 Tax=Blautia sp. HCP3S3_G3 TaxID=3438913 RepID=UPI003F8ADE66